MRNFSYYLIAFRHNFSQLHPQFPRRSFLKNSEMSDELLLVFSPTVHFRKRCCATGDALCLAPQWHASYCEPSLCLYVHVCLFFLLEKVSFFFKHFISGINFYLCRWVIVGKYYVAHITKVIKSSILRYFLKYVHFMIHNSFTVR